MITFTTLNYIGDASFALTGGIAAGMEGMDIEGTGAKGTGTKGTG